MTFFPKNSQIVLFSDPNLDQFFLLPPGASPATSRAKMRGTIPTAVLSGLKVSIKKQAQAVSPPSLSTQP
jgi:hypothetical protein